MTKADFNGLKSDEEAIEYILKAIEKAGYQPGKRFYVGNGCCLANGKGKERRVYFTKSRHKYTSNELIEHWGKS